jgi:hypothetical protein
MRTRITPRTAKALHDLAWGLAAGLAINFVAILVLFGVGP